MALLIVTSNCSLLQKRDTIEDSPANDQQPKGILDGVSSTTTTEKAGLFGGLPGSSGNGNKMIMGTFQGIISNIGMPLPGTNPFGGGSIGKK